MRHAWIEDHRQAYPLSSMCDAIKVGRSGFYAWRRRKPGQRALHRAQIAQAAAAAHARSHQFYGHRKIREDLLALDDTAPHCCKTTMWRIMRELGLSKGAIHSHDPGGRLC